MNMHVQNAELWMMTSNGQSNNAIQLNSAQSLWAIAQITIKMHIEYLRILL